jgi:hypothetical protein
MKRLYLIACFTLFAATFASAWQALPLPGPRPGQKSAEDTDVKLPDGKSQRDAILKDDYKKNLQDVAQLSKIATELKEAMEASDANIVSLKMIKQTEEIEKLAKTIRARIKKF